MAVLNFTDTQVLTLVRAYPGLNLYQLHKIAQKEMPRWPWSIGKVHKAVQRLKIAGKIETRYIVNGGRNCQLLYCQGMLPTTV
jgi:hypothetical protein